MEVAHFHVCNPGVSAPPEQMSFLKRFEVWLLLLLGGGAAIWVLLDQPTPESAPLTEEGAALTIHRCTLTRDYGNARLDIELRYQNSSPRPFILQPPDVKLMTAAGKEVPAYILPMETPTQISAQTAQNVRLRFWLEKAHLEGALTLHIREATAEVKSASSLDLEKLENQKPITWTGGIR